MKLKIYQTMHKYGKLTSCNSNKPHPIDKKFVEEIIKIIEND